jgi:hypothetical protein
VVLDGEIVALDADGRPSFQALQHRATAGLAIVYNAFVSLAEGIDATTPPGRLQLHVLGAIAEFKRERIRERVLAGLQRARTQGKRLGRPRAVVPIHRVQGVSGLAPAGGSGRLNVTRLIRIEGCSRRIRPISSGRYLPRM